MLAIHTQVNNHVANRLSTWISNRQLAQHKLIMPGFNTNKILLFDTDKTDKKNYPYPVGYGGLIAAVIEQASIDAKKGDKQAAAWLAGEGCQDFCFAIGFDHDNVKQWLKKKRLSQ